MLYRCGNILVPESNIAKIEVVNSDLVIHLLSQERAVSVSGDDAKAILARVVPLPTDHAASIPELSTLQMPSKTVGRKERGKISQLV